jgi:hypothetical protein
MVFSTSTKGTLARIAPKRPVVLLATAPTSRPPADAPSATMRPGAVNPSRQRYSAAATKSENVLTFWRRFPASYQD